MRTKRAIAIAELFAEGKSECWDCKEVKSISEFSKDKTVKSGIAKVCRLCNCARTLKYYQNNKDHFRSKILLKKFNIDLTEYKKASESTGKWLCDL